MEHRAVGWCCFWGLKNCAGSRGIFPGKFPETGDFPRHCLTPLGYEPATSKALGRGKFYSLKFNREKKKISMINIVIFRPVTLIPSRTDL